MQQFTPTPVFNQNIVTLNMIRRFQNCISFCNE